MSAVTTSVIKCNIQVNSASAATTSVPVTRTIRSARITATVSVEIATATKLLTVGFSKKMHISYCV